MKHYTYPCMYVLFKHRTEQNNKPSENIENIIVFILKPKIGKAKQGIAYGYIFKYYTQKKNKRVIITKPQLCFG